MLIRVGQDYLDFDGDIEVDESIKLFDDVSTVNGNFSYSFELQKTHNNIKILGIYFNSDIQKKRDCVLLSDSGEDIHHGYLVIEDISRTIRVSFFSGNTYWFSLLNVSCQSFRMASLDKAVSGTTITSSWDDTEGIVFPLIDNGTLSNRRSKSLYQDDFMPFVYVKDAIKGMLNSVGVKLAGSILTDYVFNNAVTTNNARSTQQSRIDRYKVYVSNGSNQTLTDGATTLIQFDTTTSPFYNSTDNNWDSVNYRYNFTENMRVGRIKYNLKITAPTGGVLQTYKVYVYYNGSELVRSENSVSLTGASNENITVSGDFDLVDLAAIGSYIDLRIEYVNYLGSTASTLLAGSTFSFEPVKFFTVHAEQLLPNSDASKFIGDFLRLINGFCSYDYLSRTLTVDTLETILARDPIDISDYIQIESVNLVEFSSEYFQNNIMRYQETDQATSYNEGRLVPYGGGNLQISDDSLEYEGDLLETDFIAAWQEDHPLFGNLPQISYVEIENTYESDVTSVTDASGYARFNYTGDLSGTALMIIYDSTIDDYNGVWEINANTGAYVDSLDIPYLGDATAKVATVAWKDADNDAQAILIKTANKTATEFVNGETFYVQGIAQDTVSIGYFNYPLNGKAFGDRHLQGLAFESTSNQVGLKQTYYRQTEQLLNDGKMVRVNAYLPLTVYRSLDFLRPVRISHEDMTGIFLLNRKTGYKGQQFVCNLELIKYG